MQFRAQITRRFGARGRVWTAFRRGQKPDRRPCWLVRLLDYLAGI